MNVPMKTMEGLMNVNGRYLWMNIKLMNMIGVWPESVIGVLRCCFAEFIVTAMSIMQCLALRDADMTEFTDLGSTVVQMIMLIFKLGYILIYRKKVLWLTRETQRQCLYLAKTFPHLRHLIDSQERRLRIVTLFLLALAFIVGMLWICNPVMIFIGIKQGDLSLPLKGQFPFDICDPFYFKLAFIFEMIIAVICIPVYPAVNIYFICLIMLTCGQLKILCSVLRSVEVKNGDEMLRRCIHVHNSILIFGKELRCVLDPIITMVFLIAMPTICQTGFQATSNLSSWETLKFLGLMSLVLCELWLCCYFGSEIIEHSRGVQLAAYSCPWYSMTNRQKKSIALIILRTQRPMCLSVGKFHNVSLMTFTHVMKYSYTMLTFLNQANEPLS